MASTCSEVLVSITLHVNKPWKALDSDFAKTAKPSIRTNSIQSADPQIRPKYRLRVASCSVTDGCLKILFHIILQWKALFYLLQPLDKNIFRSPFFEQVKVDWTKRKYHSSKDNKVGYLIGCCLSGLCPLRAKYVIKCRLFTGNWHAMG